MGGLDAYSVAELIEEIGSRLELTGESSFKIRAYRNAADALRNLREPLETVVNERRLMSLPGIGEAIAEKIIGLHKRGTHRTLERLRDEVKDGLLDLLKLPGLGPKKVIALRDHLGVDSLDSLEKAIRTDQLKDLKGFGSKLRDRLLEALDFVRSSAGRFRLPQADSAIAAATAALRQEGKADIITPAGEVRRRCETVSKLQIVAVAPKGKTLPETTGPGAGTRIVTCQQATWATTLLYATGSDKHLARLEEHARTQGFELSSNGLWKDGKIVSTPDEESVYGELGLAFVPPELREGRDEIEQAKDRKIPELIRNEDLRGILHCHSTFSDGAHSLELMARTVRDMGYAYFGIADHSQSASYAGGLKEDRVSRQHEEVDRLNEKFARDSGKTPFRIFKGIESDIKDDGSLDYPEEILRSFDFIVASVHSRFDLDKKNQTERVLRAIAHPLTTILGHCTGRLLLKRPGYEIDLDAIIAACAEHGVAIEINAHPMRLDLDWRWHATAIQAGAKLSINPDAHHTEELGLMSYGVDVARKGGVRAADVLNALDVEALAQHFMDRKS